MERTEVDTPVWVAFQPSLDAHFRVVQRFGNEEQCVDAGLGEDELLVVDGVESAGPDGKTLIRGRESKYRIRKFLCFV
jgi:hypothetical protein